MREQPGKERIVEGLVELLQTYELDEITVKLLLATAKVHRGTYYYHFRTLDDVAEVILERFLKVFDEEYASAFASGFDESRRSFAPIEYVFRHQREFRALMRGKTRDRLRDELIDRGTSACLAGERMPYLLSGDGAPLSEGDLSYCSHATAAANIALLEQWCENGFRESPEHMSNLMASLISLRI